jgi:hypothetical protein
MNHLSEDQLVTAYYDGPDIDQKSHLDSCVDCQASFARLRQFLDESRDFPVPERNSAYGAEVWARLQPRLIPPAPRPAWLRWWALSPALAAVVALAFFAGVILQKRTNFAGSSSNDRTRVLLIAMGDHLDRSQIVLAELVNSSPGAIDLDGERTRARGLLTENRLLRQTASRDGDALNAALLDELERVLMDIANTPSNAPPADLEALQRRIESDGLLFKVRVIGANVREKGQRL